MSRRHTLLRAGLLRAGLPTGTGTGTEPGARSGRVAAALVIALVAFNLRPALTSIGPVLPEIMHDTGLAAAGASLLTTLPILCLGVFGGLAPTLARRLGMERAVALLLAVLAAGLLLRGVASAAALFAGSLLAGAAIGAGNVLMPAVLKRLPFPPALLTGVYTTALCLGAAIAAGVTVPLTRAAGGAWGVALAAWAAPAAVALLVTGWVWRGAIARASLALPTQAGDAAVPLLGQPLAWQVTAFMGLQSMLAYGAFGWLAPLLRSRGDDAHTAGLVVAASIVAQVAASLPAPLLAARLRGQGMFAACTILVVVASFLGLSRAPLGWQWGLAVTLGLGMGSALALAITLIVLRSADAAVAARLSGMAQGIGYTLASLGPLGIGMLHDRTGDWRGAEAVFLVAGILAAIAGWLAGRPRLLRARAP